MGHLKIRLDRTTARDAVFSLYSRVGNTRHDASFRLGIGRDVDFNMPDDLMGGTDPVEEDDSGTEGFSVAGAAPDSTTGDTNAELVRKLEARVKELEEENATLVKNDVTHDTVQLDSLQKENAGLKDRLQAQESYSTLADEVFAARLEDLSAEEVKALHETAKADHNLPEGKNRTERSNALKETFSTVSDDDRLALLDAAKKG